MSRVLGLKGLSRNFKGQIILVPCHDIHTYTMTDQIDVAFVDEQGRVVASYRNVPPKSRYKVRQACFVVERYASQGDFWYESGDQFFAYSFMIKEN